MSKACRWLAVSSAPSKCRQSFQRAHRQSLRRRSAAGSVMQMLAAATVSDVRCCSCSPAHPSQWLIVYSILGSGGPQPQHGLSSMPQDLRVLIWSNALPRYCTELALLHTLEQLWNYSHIIAGLDVPLQREVQVGSDLH